MIALRRHAVRGRGRSTSRRRRTSPACRRPQWRDIGPCSPASGGQGEPGTPAGCPFSCRSARPSFVSSCAFRTLRLKLDHQHPLIDKSGILPGADMPAWPAAAGKQSVVLATAAKLDPNGQSISRRLRDPEGNGLTRFLLDDRRTRPVNPPGAAPNVSIAGRVAPVEGLGALPTDAPSQLQLRKRRTALAAPDQTPAVMARSASNGINGAEPDGGLGA